MEPVTHLSLGNTGQVMTKTKIPTEANFISRGRDSPILMIHGLAASLHDWDFLFPDLMAGGITSQGEGWVNSLWVCATTSAIAWR